MNKTIKTRKLDGSNEFIKCINCNETSIDSLHLCKQCNAMNVDSGNKIIDDFILGTRFSKISAFNEFLIWVPYENFTNVEYIGKGGFSEIYKATWEKPFYGFSGFKTIITEVVLKILNNSQNVVAEFLKELKCTHQLWERWDDSTIQCHGVTQIPKTKNYAFILEYAKDGDLHHFLNKNFVEITWEKKFGLLRNIIEEIYKIHAKKLLHQDLHSGNILIRRKAIISDLGFSQPANIDSRESQIYGVIPYMAPEIFKGQPYSYASDIYSLGIIMWQITSGHRPFHDQEHGPKLILDILDGKRPEITEDTPKCWANLMKRCWHPVPSQRPTTQEARLTTLFYYKGFSENEMKKKYPDRYDNWLEFKKAELKRLEMIKSKKLFVKNPGYEHPKSRYYSRSLNSMLESINSKVSDLFSNDNLPSNDHFDINSNQINYLENSDDNNTNVENFRKRFLDDEILQEDQNDLKRRKISEYFNECLADNVMD
ncbi:hypothetical protein Glove_21g401 [Diversispora epigaea]|uniref:Protein kinase domain-containing protein n=1 Tax=Diversispora epigaea TaxID=1348612 RepID=A0A397JVF8_9GLOM|nr:hypothetical protein Glove_21g401 [Diversispora epigaea]